MVITPSSGEAASLLIRDVTKIHRPAQGEPLLILDRLSLEIQPGEWLTFVGPNGCGKTTLLRLIAGLDLPTSGELRMGQQKIGGPGAERGMMFQDHLLYPWLTVRRNIETGLVAQGIFRQKQSEVEELIRIVGLEKFADAYPHQLSGGMAQRAALARALINHPKILLLDEPFGSLDQFTRMRMQEEILRLWKMRGTTMVCVTHDIDEAIFVSDRIALLTSRPGRIDQILPVSFPRPRLRTSPDFLEMRSNILDRLHLSGAK